MRTLPWLLRGNSVRSGSSIAEHMGRSNRRGKLDLDLGLAWSSLGSPNQKCSRNLMRARRRAARRGGVPRRSWRAFGECRPLCPRPSELSAPRGTTGFPDSLSAGDLHCGNVYALHVLDLFGDIFDVIDG